MAVAGIYDDSGAFLGGDEGSAGGGFAVLEDEVVIYRLPDFPCRRPYTQRAAGGCNVLERGLH